MAGGGPDASAAENMLPKLLEVPISTYLIVLAKIRRALGDPIGEDPEVLFEQDDVCGVIGDVGREAGPDATSRAHTTSATGCSAAHPIRDSATAGRARTVDAAAGMAPRQLWTMPATTSRSGPAASRIGFNLLTKAVVMSCALGARQEPVTITGEVVRGHAAGAGVAWAGPDSSAPLSR